MHDKANPTLRLKDSFEIQQMRYWKQLKSLQILDDCQRSLDLLENVPDGDKQLFRIYWTFCLVSLRCVVDVLEKYDIVTFPAMHEPYERRKEELKELRNRYHGDTPFKDCPLDYLIYHRLIHGERNIAVHEAEQTYSDPWSFHGPGGLFDLGDIYLPMDDIDLWGDWDCRDWVKEAIDWWQREIETFIATNKLKTEEN